MSVLFVLILISGIIAAAFLVGFIWSVRSGQYDDTESPSIRMLFNDSKIKRKNAERENSPESTSKGK